MTKIKIVDEFIFDEFNETKVNFLSFNVINVQFLR